MLHRCIPPRLKLEVLKSGYPASFKMKENKKIKTGATVKLLHDFRTGLHNFKKGDICVITHAGLFDVDIELKDNPKVWAIDVSYSDIEKIGEII